MLTSRNLGVNKFLKLNRLGFFPIIPLLIILIGIIVGVYLVKQTQIFKPKAYEPENIPTKYSECGDLNQPKCFDGATCVEGKCLIREQGI